MGNRALCNLGFALPFTIAGFIGLTENNAVFAQLVPDNTVGTTVTNDTVLDADAVTVLRDLIRGGTTRGNALFHSFEEFNVGEGREVIFDLQNSNILNIFTRVTGGNVSNIEGILGVLRDAASFTGSLRDLDNVSFGADRNSPINPALGNVNLFLLNPNGITFGVDARLRINGSFLATTADGFEFADASVFSASGREAPPPLLTISIPRFLSFRDNPGGITSRTTGGGGLRAPAGQTSGLIGGEIQFLNAAFRIPGGRVEIGAVGGNERVTLTETSGGYQVSYEGVNTFEDVTLRMENPETDTRRSNINVSGGDGLGSIRFQGRNVTLSDSSVLRAISGGSPTPGRIILNASERVTIETDSNIRSTVAGEIADIPENAGASITINARELLIQSGGWIDNFVTGEADGGDITINATDFVRIIGTVTDNDSGAANSIFTQAQGNSAGDAGDIIINTGQFILEDGARVSADTLGAGNGGNIIVNANEFVQITGFNENLGNNGTGSIVFTQAQESSTGNGGNISVNTPQFLVQDRAVITASNTGFGDGGNILLNVSDLVLLRNGGSISATSAGFGEGGNISLNVSDLVLLQDGSSISATSTSEGFGEGGNIFLNVSDLVLLQDGSSISATSTSEGFGGNITIDTNFVVAFPEENSDIIANSAFIGGRININATQIYGFQSLGRLTPLSDIFATAEVSGFGVQTSTPIEVIEFPEAALQTPDIVTQSACYDFGGDSQLSNTGRGGLPYIPGLTPHNSVINVDLADEVLLPPPPPEAIKPHHRTDVTLINSEGEEYKPAMGAVLLPDGMVEFVDYNPAEVYRDMYRDMYAAAGCSSNK